MLAKRNPARKYLPLGIILFLLFVSSTSKAQGVPQPVNHQITGIVVSFTETEIRVSHKTDENIATVTTFKITPDTKIEGVYKQGVLVKVVYNFIKIHKGFLKRTALLIQVVQS